VAGDNWAGEWRELLGGAGPGGGERAWREMKVMYFPKTKPMTSKRAVGGATDKRRGGLRGEGGMQIFAGEWII